MMLHQYWRSLFFSVCLLLLAPLASSNETPGIVETLQKIMEQQRNQFIKNRDDLRASIGLATPMSQEQFNQAIIHPDFINGIILKSPPRYLYLLDKNVCNFAALIDNSLLKSALGEIDEVPMIVKSNQRPFLLSKSEFIDLAEEKCPGLKRKSELFSINNLRSTLNSLKYPEPKSEQECKRIIEDWKTNPYLPYMCKIPQVLNRGRNANFQLQKGGNLPLRTRRQLQSIKREADAVVSRSTFKQRQYMSFLCSGLLSHDKFCGPYLSSEVWTKVVNKNLPDYLMSYRCQSLFNRKNISENLLRTCALKLKNEPEQCYLNTMKGTPALSPASNCNSISDALIESKLITNYNDCPGLIMNNSMNNIHRIYAHFSNNKTPFGKDCTTLPYNTLANLYIANKIEDHWPLNICYFDRIEDDKVCRMYIPGEQDSPYAENRIVTEILKRIMPMPTNTQCKIISNREYNPILLEFKVGCYIVKDLDNCNQSPCPRKIIVKEKVIEGVDYVGSMFQDYIPSTFAKKRYSGQFIMEENLKTQSKGINNFTELLVFFQQKKNGIIHGVGCLEDLLPRHFKNNIINSCRPMSFIIDGHVGGLDDKKVVFRAAIDHIHSPRILSWQNIFDAVMRYKSHHPLRTWALYGLF